MTTVVPECVAFRKLEPENPTSTITWKVVEWTCLFFWAVIRDVSGFVRLFYILSKNKIFLIFGRHILDFRPIISRFSLIYRSFSVKNIFFVKIKNKRTKPDTSQSLTCEKKRETTKNQVGDDEDIVPPLVDFA